MVPQLAQVGRKSGLRLKPEGPACQKSKSTTTRRQCAPEIGAKLVGSQVAPAPCKLRQLAAALSQQSLGRPPVRTSVAQVLGAVSTAPLTCTALSRHSADFQVACQGPALEI